MKTIRHLFVFFAAALLFSCGYKSSSIKNIDSNYFQGKIVYSYEFESAGLDADSLAMLRAGKSEMLLKNGDYHFTFFGSDTTIYLYKGDEGRCYYKRLPYPGYRCLDYQVWEDTVVKVERSGAGESVMDNETDQFVLYTNFYKTTYNLAKSIKLDPEAFAKHASTNFNVIMREGNGGIALKSVYDFPRFTVIETAKEIKPMQLDSMLFHIPDSLIKQKCQ